VKRLWIAGAVLVLAASACNGKKKKLDYDTRLLTPRETYDLAREEIQRKKLRRAIELLGRIDYRLGEDRAALEPLVRLATADATFYQNNDLALIDARALYLDFVTLYGDNSYAAYAQFQAGVCSLSQVSTPTRDQTETLQAIADLKLVETRFPDSTYATAARLLRRVAEARLVEHELIVGRFYLQKKAYAAAIERFQRALGEFPDSTKNGEMFLALGEGMVLSGDSQQGRFYIDRVITDFPGTSLEERAKKVLKKAEDQPATN
jgi:outer membrane protein assembly factor BamD